MSTHAFQPPVRPFADAGSLACSGPALAVVVQAYGDACLGHLGHYDACAAYSPPSDPAAQGTACALAMLQAAACSEDACRSACPVADNASRVACVNCTTDAAGGVCAGYAQIADSCLSDEQSDGGTQVALGCFSGGTEEGNYLLIAHLLCGS
jgi:hypothetical protein